MWSKIILTMTFLDVLSMTLTDQVTKSINYFDGRDQMDVTQDTQRYRRQVESTTTSAVTGDTTTTVLTTTTVVTVPTPPPFVPNLGTPGFTCSSDLYHRVNTRCCLLPDMIEREAVAKCNHGSGQLPMALAQRSNGKNIPLRKIVVKNSGRSVAAKNASLVMPASQICLTQCVFKYLRWMNKDNIIDENYLYTYLSIQLPPNWIEKLNTARAECTGLLTTDVQASVSNYYGRKCLLIPAKLLRCIKRHLLTNCVAQTSQDKTCLMDGMTLKSCDINLI